MLFTTNPVTNIACISVIRRSSKVPGASNGVGIEGSGWTGVKRQVGTAKVGIYNFLNLGFAQRR